MAAEHVGDRPGPGEADQPVQARGERREVADVEPSRVHRVAGDQESGPRVVDRNRAVIVTGAAGYLQPAPAEVERNDLGRPVGDPEELPRRLTVRGHHGRRRPASELSVSSDMITVTVRMRDHEL